MARLVLDTTVVIDALRGTPTADRVRGLRRSGIEPWSTVITVEEIWRGLRPGEESAAATLFRGLRLAPWAWRRDSWPACGDGSSQPAVSACTRPTA